MYKRDFFGRLYETTTLYFIRLNEQNHNEVMFVQSYFKQLCIILTKSFKNIVQANRNELMFVQSYFEQLCIILTYEHVYVLSHSKTWCFVTTNERTVRKYKF